MNRFVIIIALLLAAGMATAVWMRSAPVQPEVLASQPAFDATKPIEARLRELERAVSDERQARQLLQEEVLYLTGELEALRGDDRPGGSPLASANTLVEGTAAESPRRNRGSRRNSLEERINRLVAAGMTTAEANRVTARESRFQLEMLQARHDAERSGDYEQYRQKQRAASQAFRDELGPEGYEQYLEGTGRSTAISVSSVMDASPAQAAGLRPGDELRSYAGQRVYNMSDLNRLTLEGIEGETVYAEIIRDGIPMQIALPRGPVGITGGRRGRR